MEFSCGGAVTSCGKVLRGGGWGKDFVLLYNALKEDEGMLGYGGELGRVLLSVLA